MNHQAEVCMAGSSNTGGAVGVHMNAKVSVVVPITTSFSTPPRQAKEMKVDITKVSLHKKS